MATNYDGFTKTPSYFKYEDSHDGKRYRYAEAHTTLTVGTLYAILPDKTNHTVTAALADTTGPCRYGVGIEATTAGNIARLQTGGVYESMTTPSLSVTTNHTLETAAGAIVDGGAVGTMANNAFAINVGDTTTNSASHDVYLLDREVVGSS